ncbi:hypothetical protein [Methanocaldococcus sp.]
MSRKTTIYIKKSTEEKIKKLKEVLGIEETSRLLDFLVFYYYVEIILRKK